MNLLVYDVDYNNEISFDDGKIISIECKNNQYFSVLVDACKGNTEKGLAVMDGDDRLDLSKDAITLIDFFSLEHYEKAILGKFYKHVDKLHVNDPDMVSALKEISNAIELMIDKVTDGYDLLFDTKISTTVSEYLKFCELKPKNGFADKFDGIINLISLNAILGIYKIIFFINAKSFFDREKIAEIIKCCNYNGQKAVFIDNLCSSDRFVGETKLLIDDDFYDIIYK